MNVLCLKDGLRKVRMQLFQPLSKDSDEVIKKKLLRLLREGTERTQIGDVVRRDMAMTQVVEEDTVDITATRWTRTKVTTRSREYYVEVGETIF